jgi:two-component system nitrogen regulation response regulator NtrX
VDYFARRFAAALSGRARRFSPDAVTQLQTLAWKGNVRELRNFVERLMVLAPGETVERLDVLEAAGSAKAAVSEAALSAKTLREFREISEETFIRRKLEENDWNVTQTATSIDTPRSNLYKKMEAYGIRRQGTGEGPEEPESFAGDEGEEA